MAWVKPRTRKDGSVYYSVFFREDGRQTSISWEDVEDAERCRQLIDQVGAEKAREIMRIIQSPRQAQTLTQFLTKHIDRLASVEHGTIARYRSYVRNDIADTIGEIPLTALSRDDISGWIGAMVTAGKSGKTIANKHGFLAGALKAAVRDGHLKANPCDDNRLPRWDREEMQFLDPAEYQLLLSEIPDYWKPLIEFLVMSGCRWSEATALKPAAINVTAGTVRVTKAWKNGPDGYVLGVPKTKKSVRTINVPTEVLKQLDLTGEWVFTNSGRGKGNFADGQVRADAGPVRIHSFHPNVWRPALARAKKRGLTKNIRIHDLRHTCASWLMQSGRPLPAIQAQLGHESVTTTISVYSHLDRSSGRDNADALAAMLRPAASPSLDGESSTADPATPTAQQATGQSSSA